MFLGSTHRLQPVDLEPLGNTISVELSADNPFETARDVEVYTQMSGGLADADESMRSPGILTPVMTGEQAMIPISGLGQQAAQQPAQPTVGQQLALAAIQTATNVGTGLFNNYLQNQQAKRDERLARAQAMVTQQQARIAEAQSRAEAARAAAYARAAAQRQAAAAAARRRQMMYIAIGGGVLLLLLLGVFTFRSKSGGGGSST
ncbi:MAG: hypothetical protein RMK43_12900 [Cyclobacteriaceae bacterium]|nr:hypothetical protein [Cyclobacteriaceae bacterium]